jgi:two-component system, NarL family, response regulator NreC
MNATWPFAQAVHCDTDLSVQGDTPVTASPAPSASKARSVVIADDRPIFRHGLRNIIEQCGLIAVAEATTIAELHRDMRELDPDMVIVNIEIFSMEEVDEIIRLLPAARPQAGTLVLTIYENPVRAQQMFRAGSHACVHHSADAEELKCALQTILTGGYYLDSRLGEKVLKHEVPEPRFKLTPTELKILALIAEGLTNRQIAEKVYLSLRSVESQRANLKKKLGLYHRSELSRFVRQHYPALLTSSLPTRRRAVRGPRPSLEPRLAISRY